MSHYITAPLVWIEDQNMSEVFTHRISIINIEGLDRMDLISEAKNVSKYFDCFRPIISADIVAGPCNVDDFSFGIRAMAASFFTRVSLSASALRTKTGHVKIGKSSMIDPIV